MFERFYPAGPDCAGASPGRGQSAAAWSDRHRAPAARDPARRGQSGRARAGRAGDRPGRRRAGAVQVSGPGLASPGADLAFTPEAEKAIASSLRESLRLRHDFIGPEHLLLALAAERDSAAVRVSARSGCRHSSCGTNWPRPGSPAYRPGRPARPARCCRACAAAAPNRRHRPAPPPRATAPRHRPAPPPRATAPRHRPAPPPRASAPRLPPRASAPRLRPAPPPRASGLRPPSRVRKPLPNGDWIRSGFANHYNSDVIMTKSDPMCG